MKNYISADKLFEIFTIFVSNRFVSASYRLYPTSTELSVNLSLIFMHMDEFKRAFNQLGTTIAHDPTNAEALFTFAAEIQVRIFYSGAGKGVLNRV